MNNAIKDVNFRMCVWKNFDDGGYYYNQLTACLNAVQNRTTKNCFFKDMWGDLAEMAMLPFVQVGEMKWKITQIINADLSDTIS
jgi:hypothetical protein